MFSNPSLVTRLVVGKSVGFIFGILGILYLYYWAPQASTMFNWGFLFWYPTVGAFIALCGVFAYIPVLNIVWPWWIRGPYVAAWMNFILTLFAYDQFKSILSTAFGGYGELVSPFWFVLEGIIVGLIIDFLATRFGGDGPQTVSV